MKLKKKIIIPIVAVAVIGGAALFLVPKIVSAASPKLTTVSATPLLRMDLENTVSVTGTVKSEDVTNIYSNLTYQVKKVNVKVGDTVKEGDVLCELDDSELIEKINQQTATLSLSQAQAQHNLAVAQNELDTEKFNQEYNYDSKLTAAERAVEQAERKLSAAQWDLRSSELKAGADRKALHEYREENGYNNNNYDADEAKLKQSVQQDEVAVELATEAVEQAKKAVSEAKADLNAAKVLKEEALISIQDKVDSSKLNANLSDKWMQLDDLKKDLDDVIVKAPVSGTVTTVLATQGASGQGLLFVIENTDKLRIDTKIKEYDIPSVKVGQSTKVKSDGTGDIEYAGSVSKIAPTAIKDAKGETQEITDVEFVTEVGVVEANDLRIGMNARVDIITEKKNDIFAVPYDAVIENENGESVVYVARPQSILDAETGEVPPVSMSAEEYSQDMSEGEAGQQKIDAEREKQQTKNAANNGGMTAVAVVVQTGMETDFYIEILSDALNEGDLIISDPAGLADGQAIALDEASSPGGAGARQGGGPRGGMAVRAGR